MFAEQLRNLQPEPISSSFDLARMIASAGGSAAFSGSAGGTAQVFHTGTPSASEHTATEGNGSSNFQTIPSQSGSSVSPISSYFISSFAWAFDPSFVSKYTACRFVEFSRKDV